MSTNSLTLTTSRFGRFHNEQESFSGDQNIHEFGPFGNPYHLYREPLQEDIAPLTIWRLFEERLRTGPYGLTRFPLQPHSPVRILLVDGRANGGTNDGVSPRLRQFIRDSPPRIRQEWQLGAQQDSEDTGLSNEEFKKAMKRLRKQVYNPPPHPRRRAFPQGLFGSRTGGTATASADMEKEDGRDCTICLETFSPNEQVLVTPCNHMFHKDCLVPWVKSRGKCPVCRHVFYERRDNNNAVTRSRMHYNNNIGSTGGDDIISAAADVILLTRAMEEAFNWVNSPRPGLGAYQ